MPSVRLINLTKNYRIGRTSVRAINGVTLEAPDGQILTLLGPSGCGKSSTLRCVAGLERPDDGEILFDERPVFSRTKRISTPAERRNVGMVFQSYAIWPHLTVFENVAYPLRVRRLPSREVRTRVREALSLVGLAELEERPAPFLSGGQQQRVAVARALVYRPEVLLLDEPLSNLDAKVREQVREDLRALQRRLAITTIYVTHDQLEALALSDLVAVMHEGQVIELGTPHQLYTRPRTRFTGSFLGEISYLTGTVVRGNGAEVTLDTPWGPLRCQHGHELPVGARVVAGVRPEHVTLTKNYPGLEPNVLEGTVVSELFEGTRVKYRVDLGDLSVLAFSSALFKVGERVHAAVDPDRVILLPDLSPDR